MTAYLDNAATTQPAPQLAEVFAAFLADPVGNPSSVHRNGERAKNAIADVRQKIADFFEVASTEVFFTASGSESNNWALLGTEIPVDSHVVISALEHKSVSETISELQRRGHETTILAPDERGIITAQIVHKALRPSTSLVSVMAVNNEVGTIQETLKIKELCDDAGVLFHCDAVQAVGKIATTLLPKADLISISPHKFHGLPGIGILIARGYVQLSRRTVGGGQEFGKRAGTENSLAIRATGKILEWLHLEEVSIIAHLLAIQAQLETGLRSVLGSRFSLIGESAPRAPHISCIQIPGVLSEESLRQLDQAGISASTGAACSSYDLESSATLKAMGYTRDEIRTTLRFSFSAFTTSEEIDYTIATLNNICLHHPPTH